MNRRRGYSSSEEEEEDSKTGQQKKGNQFVQRTKQLSPMQDDTYSDPTQYIPGPDYSDSDYLGNSSLSETVGVVGGPRYPPVGNTNKRSLNDRVRDYTGVRQDERLEHPAGSSSSRSSDSRSPFLDPSSRTGRRRGQGSTSPRDPQVEWSGLALAERNYETVPALRGEAVWETKLDQEYLKYGTVGNNQRPDIVLANIQGNKTLGHKPIYCPDPSETAALVGAKILMPGFPVQTLGGHQSPPYSPSREKPGLLGRPCAPYCSWRLVALSLTLLILLLASVIVYFGAVKYPQPLPPLPNSVIDSNGLRDLNCPPVNTQLEEPSGGLQVPWTGPRSSPSPASLLPGQWLKAEVPPLSTWTGRIAVSRTALYQLNFTLIAGVGEGAALFGRLQAVATVTRHDWQEYLVSSRQRRAVSSTNLGVYTVERSLSDGAWFLSLYNDGPSRLQFGLVVNERAGGRGCEHNCSGRGRCLPDGECQCEAQFSGTDCSANICPVLCSGHGDYGGGRCHCEEGWKGEECNVRLDECEVPDCSGQGDCIAGECLCDPGWTGRDCEQTDCLDRECSDHGSCALGHCYCEVGWTGTSCEQRNDRIFSCLPDCSGHGTFDLTSGHCNCHGAWTGLYCNITLCSLDCGSHGSCEKNSCQCDAGWTGVYCESQSCSGGCEEHGQCRNGTCVCQQGWNGRHCSLEGCRNDCHGRGECRQEEEGDHQCACRDGWSGKFCEQEQEQDCEDEVDNDKDGLTDCGDSNCCSHPACRENIMCVYFADPVDVLLRKPPPAASASFFQKVRFLIEGDKSVQSYSKPESYDQRRAAVIRGRVVTASGEGIIGVRVSVDRSRGASNYGFTLTRPGGWFDMLVNGGGAVTLQFQRSPFKPLTRTSYIPWNQIHVIDPVVMASSGGVGISWEEEDTSIQLTYSEPCPSHCYNTMKPLLMTSHRSSQNHATHNKQTIFSDSGVLRKSVQIPGSDVHLVYHSSSATAALSVLYLRLTPCTVPPALHRVHIKIVVAGVVFKKTFEGEANLVYTYGWNKRNVYNQKVYTDTDVRVSVGYQYRDCAATLWETQTTKLAGFQVDISDIGGWDINIHHHYNAFEGTLQKGDGSRENLFKRSLVLAPMMGSGAQRDFQCEKSPCHGAAATADLLNVVTMTTGPDGSIYVGDYNLIRKIDPSGNVFTILHFSSSQGSFLYEISISPADDSVYMTNSERHQVWRILRVDDVTSPTDNWEVMVGTGERCVPGDKGNCGDGGMANAAKLSFPKGLAISVDKTMYISDGKNIRVVFQNGKIDTLIGTHSTHHTLKPIGCISPYLVSEVELHWPTKLALSPLDSTLHIVDDSQVLRLTPDLRLSVVAGRSIQCSEPLNHTQAQKTKFGPIVDIGFAQDGNLFIAEKTGQRVTAVQKVSYAGSVQEVLGDPRGPGCICEAGNCSACAQAAPLLASQVAFKVLSAFAVSPEGNLHVADNKALQIFTVKPETPQADASGLSKLVDVLEKEVYVFNKYGQHLKTESLETRATKYNFEYSKSSGFGKLLKVSDSTGNKILLQRDYTHQVQVIENTFGQKYSTKMNSLGKLQSFQITKRQEVKFGYKGNDFLLETVAYSNGNLFNYKYSAKGALIQAISPTGESFSLTMDPNCLTLDNPGLCLLGYRNSRLALNITASAKEELYATDSECSSSLRLSDLQLDLSLPSCASVRVTMEDAPGPSSGLVRQPRELLMLVGGKLISLESQTLWQGGRLASSNTQINSSQLVGGVEYGDSPNSFTLSDSDSLTVLEASWSSPGLAPTSWGAAGGMACSSSFDSYGRVTRTQCGAAVEEKEYNSKDQSLLSQSMCNGQSAKFMYENHELPREVTLASGRKLTFIYDSLGGLEQVMLPRGARHSFWVQQSLQYRKLSHLLPGSSDPYTTYWDLAGNLLQLRPPGNKGIVLQRYSAEGRKEAIVAGDRSTLFQYNQQGLLTHIEHMREVVVRTTMGYNQGLLTDMRIKFNAKSALADAKFSYDHDKNLNIKRIRGRIGGQPIPRVGLYFGKETWGGGSDMGDFILQNRGLNGSVLSDGKVRYSRGDAFLTLTIDDKEAFRAEYVFNECNKIKEGQMLLKRASGFFKQTKRYSYDDDGQLLEVRENSHVWKYDYDSNGNMIKLLFGKSDHLFSYDDWDQLIQYNQAVLAYDSLGRVVRNYKKQQFSYGSNSLLKKIAQSTGTRREWSVKYFYDEQDRLIGRKDSGGNLTQYHYTMLDRPFLVTHVYTPREGKLTSLVYDEQDRLIYVQVNQDKYYVVCDQVLAPFLFFSPNGDLVKEVSRSPYGHVTYDSYPSLHIPIGIFGGLEDEATGLIHIQEPGRRTVYDPFVGSYLTPDWETMTQYLHQPELFLLYRIQGNDPVNLQRRRLDSNFARSQEATMDILSQPFPLFDQEKVATLVSKQLFPENDHSLSMVTSMFLEFTRTLEHPNRLLKHTSSALLSTSLQPSFLLAHRTPSFGDYIVLSKQGDKVEVHSGPGANQIYQNVFTSVLNDSFIVDFETTSHSQDSFYFTKSDSWRTSDDIAQLRRLGSKINLTVHENQFDTTKTMDVKVHMLSGTLINIRYGTDPVRERARLLRHAARVVAKRAWGEEQSALQRGEKTENRWTQDEASEIESLGEAKGWDVEYHHPPSKFPELAVDLNNVVFAKSGGRKHNKHQ